MTSLETQAAKPLASIVIPVFNGMPYVKEALESALAQDYDPLEIVVVDNASNDGTSELLEDQTDARLRVIHRTSTQSAADNWTQAIKEAQGAFIKLMCADDLLEPHAIETQIDALLQHPQAGMAASTRTVINGAGEVVKAKHGLNGLRGEVPGNQALKACLRAGTNLFGEPVCVLFRAGVIRDVMPWESQLPYMTDLATYARVLQNGHVVCQQESLATFRISATSWSSSLLAEQPRQFAAWRLLITQNGTVRWSAVDQTISNVNLSLRTVARRLFFEREKRAAAKR